MAISRRSLFGIFAALPFVKVAAASETKHPLLLEGVIKHKKAWAEMLDAKVFKNYPSFYIGINQLAKYRWVADTDEMEGWLEKHPQFKGKIK